MILLSLVDGTPRILGLREILEHYIEHQKQVIIRRTKYDLEKAEERRHLVEGLCIALANIDEVVAIIKASTDRYDAQAKLMEKFLLSEKQANAILEMRLQRLTSLEVEKLKDELENLDIAIKEYKSIINTPQRILDIIKTEMTEIRDKYADARRSEMNYDYTELNIADLIEKEDIVVSMTHFGYIKRISVSEYKSQRRGGVGITAHRPKEEDFVVNMFTTNTHNDLLFFTNLGKVYSIKGYEVPEAERTARGRAIVNLLQLSPDEKVTAFMPKDDEGGYTMLATKKGLIKKTSMEEFASIRKVGKRAISLMEDDELVSVILTTGDDEILIASSTGKCIRFGEQGVRKMGRDTQGVKSMKLSSDERIVDMTAVRPGYEILTITENGYGKRTDPDDYRLQSRAGKGIKAGVFNDKTGNLVNLKLINAGDDLMIISDNGTIIRMNSMDISKISRATQGVRVMRIQGDSKVVCVAITPKAAEEDMTE